MAAKEATARIKINKILEAAGWLFFAEGSKSANIRLETTTNLSKVTLEKLGENFEKSSKGFVDFLLLDSKGFPLIVLEAKSEDKHPLVGKEQARGYAQSQGCRFVILSNGNLHYFWDLDRGNPSVITVFPTPESIGKLDKVLPDPKRLLREEVEDDYIVLTQRPTYRAEAGWKIEKERTRFIEANKLRFLRPYQIRALCSLQSAIKEGKERFLFEMATGTGKTLVAAAAIKLFFRTGNASRVLFLVDRLELEDQARKAFVGLLATDFQTIIYKENRDDWRRAEIVVTTVQSLLFDNKYRRLFSPTDFDLVISDEAHRSIGGNARAVFDYFVGWKLGLTATPRDYLKRFDLASANDPRETERRLLLDTYRTFDCENGQPTFRYSLLDGVKEGFLINPIVIDARTEITAALLSEQGFSVDYVDEEGEERQVTYRQREFERQFYSDATNLLLCQTFLENAFRDPISGEIGKSIVFAVSQYHAARLSQLLNQVADRMFPGKYHSDFAVQVTSQIPDAQLFTINFANNKLLGSANFIESYKTSRARVCVTVGMMTTGYDCPDILNLALMRPVFSPTDFIQIKGRGTRKHDFRGELFDLALKEEVAEPHKKAFKLFDFFANCEYFEERFDYDEVIELPKGGNAKSDDDVRPPAPVEGYDYAGADSITEVKETPIGLEGMKIDRMFFARFEDAVRADEIIAQAVEAGNWERVIDYVNRELFDKPEEYFTLDKLRKAAAIDRKLTLREILEKIFGLIPGFKSRDELLEEEFAKFIADSQPEEPEAILAIKTYFKAYVTDERLRAIIETRRLTELNTNPTFSTRDYKAVPERFRTLVPTYVKDYVSLSQFVA